MRRTVLGVGLVVAVAVAAAVVTRQVGWWGTNILVCGTGLFPPRDGGLVPYEVGQRGTVAGRVVSGSGVPIETACVRVWDFVETAGLDTKTDGDGLFEIESVPAGRWTLVTHAKGFFTERGTPVVVLPREKTTDIDIVLTSQYRSGEEASLTPTSTPVTPEED